MPEVQVRKNVLMLEEVFHEGGPVAQKPLSRVAALAVIHNPYAGAYVEKIEAFMDDLKPLGLEMARRMVVALGGDPKLVEGYGKGAIVGSAGEIEHGALWHAPGGYAMRDASFDDLAGRKVVDQAPNRPCEARIAVIPAGIAHGAGFHAAARHLGENLIPERPERLDRRARLWLAKLRVKLYLPVWVA